MGAVTLLYGGKVKDRIRRSSNDGHIRQGRASVMKALAPAAFLLFTALPNGPAHAQVDLALEIEPTRTPLMAGEVQILEMTVTNHGPDAASAIAITSETPEEITFLSSGPRHSDCAEFQGLTTCTLDELEAGGSALFWLAGYVDPLFSGEFSTSASVSSNVPDAMPADNTATVETAIDPRMIVQSISDVDGNGADDVAVLVHESDLTQVVIKDGKTGNEINTIEIEPGFLPVDLKVLSHYGATPADEVAVLARDPAQEINRVFVRDAADGSGLGARAIAAVRMPRALEIIPDQNGTAAEELVIVAWDPQMQRNRISIKDPRTSGSLLEVVLNANHIIDLEVLPAPEPPSKIALLTITKTFPWPQVSLYDSISGERTDVIDFPSRWVPLDSEIVADISGNSQSEFAILVHHPENATTRVFLADSATEEELPRITVHDSFVGRDLEVVPDFAGSGAEELAISLTRRSDGLARVWVKDADTNQALSKIPHDSVKVPHDIAVIESVGGTEADDILILGTDGAPEVVIRDAQSEKKLKTLSIP